MKQIIIFLLLIILLIIGYSQYKTHQRFSLESYEYKPSENIDKAYHDKAIIYHYYDAIEDANSHVISEWSMNNIDVRNPKKDNIETNKAVNEYAEKLTKIKYYESQLEQSKMYKNSGLSNHDIKALEYEGKTPKTLEKESFEAKIKMLFQNNRNLRLGESNVFAYEIQKLLIAKGYTIPLDGVYKNITSSAIKSFEEKHGLFADGKMDILTLETLLN